MNIWCSSICWKQTTEELLSLNSLCIEINHSNESIHENEFNAVWENGQFGRFVYTKKDGVKC